jgi:hypothetical protein
MAVLIGCAKNKKERKALSLIWSVFMWVMWSVRNDVVFSEATVIVDEVVEKIKMLSWKWYYGRIAKGPILLYEWEWSPLDCMVH